MLPEQAKDVLQCMLQAGIITKADIDSYLRDRGCSYPYWMLFPKPPTRKSATVHSTLNIYFGVTNPKKATKKMIMGKKACTCAKSRSKCHGYMQFVKVHYDEVKEENPDLSFGEIGRLLGEMWRDLSDEEKEEYK